MSTQIESSLVAETNEDFISGKFCECKHLLKEHSTGKCYALVDNGGVWASCGCVTPKILSFQLKVSIEIKDAETST
jgi:hypothetical protein